MLLTARVMLTLAALGYGAVPVAADFNRTHAINPRWTGHARFHVVWQGLSYVALGIVALELVWVPASNQLAHVRLAALIASCLYAGFFGAVLSRSRYEGRLHDDNGYRPVPVRTFGSRLELDLNTMIFSAMTLILGVAWILILAD